MARRNIINPATKTGNRQPLRTAKAKTFTNTPTMPETNRAANYLPVNVLYLSPEQFARVTQMSQGTANLAPELAEPGYSNVPLARHYVDKASNAEAGMLQNIINRLRGIDKEVSYVRDRLMSIHGEGMADESNKEKPLLCPVAEIDDLLIKIYVTATDVSKRIEKL